MIHNNNILKTLAFAFLSISVLCFVALTNTYKLVKEAEIEPFLQAAEMNLDHSIHRTQAQLDFWQEKLRKQPSSSIYKLKTASLLSERFKQTGDIRLIHQSDSLLMSALKLKSIRQAPFYRALSTNAITQHQFKEALEFADRSLETAIRPEASHLLRFDAFMELGQVEEARKILNETETPDSFEIMIRKAKLQDHDGDLDAAIRTMEEAAQWCRERQNKALLCWAMSNLGDMYGHAGRLKNAYQSYLDVLQLDPTYLYALKGMAWIAYSRDKNVPLAEKIIEYIREKRNSPDLLLFLSEMALYEGRKNRAEALEKEFVSAASRPEYGNMYDRYLAEIFLDRPGEWNKARFYIEKEIKNRPLAASYVLWADYQLMIGSTDKAVFILEEHVVEKTFEPDVLLRVGEIYKKAAHLDQAEPFLENAAKADFELGPLTSERVKDYLKEIKFAQ